MVKIQHLRATKTPQTCTREEIKSKLNSGKVCYHSAENLLPSRLTSENVLSSFPVVVRGGEI
jgi:hypothetical protein